MSRPRRSRPGTEASPGISGAAGCRDEKGRRAPSRPNEWLRRGPFVPRMDTVNAEPRVKDEAIQVLTSMNRSDAVDAVRDIVSALRERATVDPNPQVRRAAVQVLGSMPSPDAVDAPRGTLHDRHPG